MASKQQKFRVRISGKFDANIRRAIGTEIIDQVVERTQKGFDKRLERFPAYSKDYKKSLDFKIAGKAGKPVNLTLSEEMLNSLKIVKHGEGFIDIGFNKGDKRNNGVAEGNIRGTYGKPRGDRSKRRDFLGIHPKELEQIKEKYPARNLSESRSRARLVHKATSFGKNLLERE